MNSHRLNSVTPLRVSETTLRSVHTSEEGWERTIEAEGHMRVNILEFCSRSDPLLARDALESWNWRAFCLFEVELRLRVRVEVVHLMHTTVDRKPPSRLLNQWSRLDHLPRFLRSQAASPRTQFSPPNGSVQRKDSSPSPPWLGFHFAACVLHCLLDLNHQSQVSTS